MSDSKEKSDDLIAELAKLMASNAQGSESDPKQTVIKLPPLGEASVPSPGPVRIPGMDAPRTAGETGAAPASAAPTVRIPGMEKPAGISDPQPSAELPARPASQLDFGRPPSAMPALKSEPLTNWQAHQSSAPPAMPQPLSAPEASPPETRQQPRDPAPAQPPAAAPAAGAEHQIPVAASPAPVAQDAHPPQSDGSGFNFDFGFGAGRDDTGSAPAAPPTDDPIADLIAAELDAADAAPESRPAQRSQPAESTALQPAAGARPVQSAAPRQAAVATPLKPVSVTPRAAEGDRFATAPVFGGHGNGHTESARISAPAAPQATALTTRQREELDPIEEIESLIGEAVRVELSAPGKPAQRVEGPPSAPVVPPLSTGFAPRRAGLADSTNHAQSAEDAILAAAAASGADVDRIDAPEAEDRPYKRMKVKPPRTSVVPSGARQYVGIAVAGTLLLAAGFGLYWVLGMGGGGDPATAPVLTADATPAKVEPAVTPVTAAEPSGSVVFDEIAGGSGGDVETLVSRDETAGASVAEVARTVTPVVEEVAETGLANRKVRTVTVRPDGTIVSADDAIAGTEALPVERPNVPEIEGEGIEPSELLTAAVAESGQGGTTTDAGNAVDPIAALVAETGEATTTPLQDPAPLDVAALDTGDTVRPVFDGSLTPPIPMPRPSDRGSLVGSGTVAATTTTPAGVLVNEPASTPLVAVTQGETAAAAPAAARSGAYAQIASLPTESDAQSQVRAQTGRFGSLFNGASLEVRRVDLGAKGVWYRVVLPVSSFREATQVCATIQANGGDCIPNGG